MLSSRIKKIYFSRHILWDLSLKQLKVKYAGSMLGLWWTVIIPIVLALSINFIFAVVFKVAIKNFTLFVLSGLIPWMFFSGAINEAANSFIANAPILKQGIFPRELIPISSVIANFLSFAIGLLLLLFLFVCMNLKVITLLPFLLPLLVSHLIFMVGLGVFLSSVSVFFRDLTHLLSIGLMIWFWITPIFYSLDMLEFPYRWICLLNPMTYYVVSYRMILFEAKPLSPLMMPALFLISAFFFITGYFFFLKKEPEILKKI